MWHEIVTTWSPPWGSRNKSFGALCISSTVDIVYNSIEALHMALDFCHMEYSIWHQKVAM